MVCWWVDFLACPIGFGWLLVLSQSMLRNWKPSSSAEIQLAKAKLTDVASGA